ncbi:MAG TPA: hypothetical protein DCZ11_03180 [Gammaproteobacteria bacterium]|nr:hypothetical protein [Gammaproteobacteria bacterium]MCH77429.1 hypothetical protein [Gammaproteobacteria bacterium]
MTITKLSIANGALRLLREHQLSQAELTNGSREPARVFNAIWDDGGVRACLEAGAWKFAKRSVQIDYSPSVAPAFGYQYAFDKPTDWVSTMGVYADANMVDPYRGYREEGAYWLAGRETLYVSYVSNANEYGGDFSLWPQTFNDFVQAHFASKMAGPMTDAGKEMLVLREQMLQKALASDAHREPARAVLPGTWAVARRAGRNSLRENW